MQNNHTVAIINHGCKLNQYEGESIEYSLKSRGYRIVDLKSTVSPDVVIVNTCTVTNRSDRKSRNTILRAARMLGEKGLLIVTGCYAQTDPHDLKRLRGVDLVIGNRQKAAIPDIIASHIRDLDYAKKESGSFDYEAPITPHRSRVFIKVQDGCNMHCAYCKVPLARGKSVSREPESVVDALNRVQEKGFHEVVLTGVNIGSYNWHGRGLDHLLTKILHHTTDKLRIRLSSIEPESFTKSLLDIIAHPRIMPHFHVPLQSGSDHVLKRMNRSCGTGEYVRIVENIRQLKPESHIATDIIVGFPGESKKDFTHTLGLVERVHFASLHVFRFSPRAGTAAALLEDELTASEKAERSRKLIEMGRRLNYDFRRQFEGTVRDAVFEKKRETFYGITDNYIRVRVSHSDADLSRRLLPVKIIDVGVDETTGCVV